MNQVVPNFKQPKVIADREYIGFVKQLPCVICQAFGEPYGQAPSDAHHPICGRYSQRKAPDHTAIPLCKGHHQTGENGKLAIHRGKESWAEKYGADTDYVEVTQDAVKTIFGYTPKGLR